MAGKGKKKGGEETATETATAGRDVFRMSDDATISFGTDKEGNALSAETSPKKGENSKQRWGLYRDGMTVKDALAAGLTRSNIRKDRRAGFIKIENPPAPAGEADAA